LGPGPPISSGASACFGTEARLVTVITFWNADGFAEARERKMARLRQKLQPYLDQSLRMQSFSAHLMDGNQANEAAMPLAGFLFSF